MKLTKIFTILLAFFSLITQAQVVDKTEEKAKQKTEQRIDQKIDNGIDNGLDAIEGLFSKKKKKKEVEEEDESESVASNNSSDDAQTAAMMKMMGGSDVQVQDEYKFDHRFVILMEDYDKKGKLNQSNEMTFLSKEESSVMGILMNQEGINTEMIYDLGSYEIVTLMNTGGQKIGTTMSIDKEQVESMMAAEDTEAGDMSEMPTFKKTGNTKSISGYSCDEYVVENVQNMEGSMTYWITDELEIDWIKSMANMSSMNKQMPDMYAGSGYPEDGSVIQMIITEKNGERMEMTVKEAETGKEITISTKGYTFMNMPGR
ncbi:MAG: hypothetical protein WBG42_08380 [Cryomorphaceae bacterium]